MGIGRRRFLQLFGATIASAAIDPLQSIILSDDLYINRTLGLAFIKPKGWKFASVRDFGKIRESQILKDDELSKKFLTSEEPFAIIVKSEPDDPRTVDACMTLYVEDLPLLENEKLIEIVPKLEKTMQRVLKGYSHTGEVNEINLSNCESVEYFSNFQFETNIISAPIRNRCIVTSRESQLFTFNMFDYPQLGISAQEEYEMFVNSIRYV